MASKILLADDSITIQKVVNLTFADEGIDVITVSNGEMAERRLSEINPDLVLADIFMPGKNGYELCQFIKDTPPFQNIPVVLLVGAFEPFDQSEARRVKADGHLTKPFESRTLVETVRKLIQTSRSKAGSARQAPAKPSQPVRDTRPLGPESESHQDTFIDISQIAGDRSEQVAPQNGSPATPTAQEMPLPAAAGSNQPDVDYHGLWEMGTAPDPGAGPNGGIAGEISFGIGPQDGPPAAEPHQSQLFSPGFEISAPEAAQPEPQPIASGFEFGFVEASPDTAAESATTQVTKGPEPEPTSIPFVQTNGAAEQTTGFAVPSMFSSSGPEHVLDFNQVDAPESPAPANEVAFEVSSTLVTTPGEPEPAVEPAALDGKYFDLITQDSPVSPAPPSATEPPEGIENLSDGRAEIGESGFDLAEPVVIAERRPVPPEEEPLGDVLSQDKELSAPGQETAFAIAEEAITVDVRPASGESLRMILPPAREGELTGAWADLDSDHKAAVSPQAGQDEGVAANLIGGGETLAGFEPAAHASPERSFDISESGAVISPFDPRELRADEPSEPTVIPPFRSDFQQSPVQQFTSSLLWSEENRGPSTASEGVEEPPAQVLAPPIEHLAPALPTAAFASEPSDTLPQASDGQVLPEVIPEVIEVATHSAEPVQSTVAPVNGIAAEPKLPAASVTGLNELSPGAIEEIVRRVVLEMSDAVVRELAWEILPDCVERVVEKLSRESLAKKL